ncbi:MAG TPA: DivIVA domain-containing protein [Atribacterota bacterium]|nr:DivIVA domain-containing protein [Atribacterota bacterium]
MRISPMDIEQQQFGRSFRGYNEEEVDNFLDRIAKDYEEVLNENVKSKDEVERLQAKLAEYLKMEETLRTALVNAQQSASSIREAMQKEAQNLIETAQIEAERIKQKAMQEILDTNNEITTLQKRKFLILEKLKNTLKLHIRMLDEEMVKESDEETSNQYIHDKTIENLKMRLYPEEGQGEDVLNKKMERKKINPDL